MFRILSEAKALREHLLRVEADAAQALVNSYGEGYLHIRAHLESLTAEITEARRQGEAVTPAWLMRRDRLASLLRLVELRMRMFTVFAARRVTEAQSLAVEMGQAHTLWLASQGLGLSAEAFSLTRLPHAALEVLIGRASDGSSMRSMLEPIGAAAVERARMTMLKSVVLERGPAETLEAVRDALGLELTHALTVSRTESFNAYRESTRRAYRANREQIVGWVWVSNLSPRTCPLCWAMHGTFHEPDESMDAHFNCRCIAVPIVRDAEEGFETGTDLFDQLPEDVQREVLGAAAFAAFKQRRVRLEDFAGERRTSRWGRTRYTRSLREVLG